MEKKENKYLYGLTIILAVAVVGLSVAYAALSANLSAQFNTVTQGSASWHVGFQGSSATAVPLGTSGEGRTCGAATVTSSSVIIGETTLSKPDDGCRYELTVENTGTIDAKLDTSAGITWTKPDNICTISGATMVCGNITYKITTDPTGNTPLTTGGTLSHTSPNNTLKIYLTVLFTGTEVGGSGSYTNGKFTLYYVQA